MKHWLTSPFAKPQPDPPREPQTFAVPCVCGRTMHGTRTSRYQQKLCPQCQAVLFVLPESVYPPPKPPKKKVTKTLPEGTEPAGDVREAPPPITLQDRIWHKLQARWQSLRGVLSGGVGAWVTEILALVTASKTALSPRTWYTPFRGLLLGIGCVILLTGYWLWHNRALAQAEIVLKDSVKQAQQALLDDDMLLAAEQFTLAQQALDTLGRRDSKSQLIRQQARETQAISRLLDNTLSELVQEAQDPQFTTDSSSWQTTFNILYRDRWVILETAIRGHQTESGRPRYVCDSLFTAGLNRIELVTDLACFEGQFGDGEPHLAIFAAQLQECRPHPTQPQTWQLIFRPDTAFFWATRDTYRSIGLYPTGTDDHAQRDRARIDQILASQSRILGLEP